MSDLFSYFCITWLDQQGHIKFKLAKHFISITTHATSTNMNYFFYLFLVKGFTIHSTFRLSRRQGKTSLDSTFFGMLVMKRIKNSASERKSFSDSRNLHICFISHSTINEATWINDGFEFIYPRDFISSTLFLLDNHIYVDVSLIY